jgi:hypothetical protein
MDGVAPEARFNKIWTLWAVGSLGLILMASVYDTWTDAERDAFKTGWHDCKEDLPPIHGVQFDDEYQCEAYYEGFWRALEARKAAAAAAIASGLAALYIHKSLK